jgi:hypothetical protein
MMAGVRLSERAIEYGWSELRRRAGISSDEVSAIPFTYGHPSAEKGGPSTVTVVPCAPHAWERLLQCHSIEHLPAAEAVPGLSPLPTGDSIPVVLWGEGCENRNLPFAERGPNGGIVFYADIIASTVFMLTRWEESATGTRDAHGRFPASESVAFRNGFLDRPVVDEYALVLRAWLEALIPGWTATRNRFRIKLSHDIDHVRWGYGSGSSLRRMGSYVVRQRRLTHAIAAAGDIAAGGIAPGQTRYHRDIHTLANLSKEGGLGDDSFYFMATGRRAAGGRYLPDYDPESSSIKRTILRLRGDGFEVGLHPGYDTLGDPDRLSLEKHRLDAVLGVDDYGGRQHFLRCAFPQTWRDYEAVGLTHDASAGYADHEGFRCGTCHPFRPFDLEADRVIDVWERPLIVMEGTLRGYRRVSAQEAEMRIIELAERCCRVEGVFSLLWHNHTLSYEWAGWAGVYERTLASCAKMRSGSS